MELWTNNRHEPWKAERVQTKLNNSEGGGRDKGVAYGPSEPCNWSGTTLWEPERLWEQTQGEVDQVIGSRIRPKEKGTKEAWVVQNKELTQESGPEVALDETRLEGGISKATWIGNPVGIENMLGIDWEGCWSLDCEGEGYAGAEGRQNEWDLNQKL